MVEPEDQELRVCVNTCCWLVDGRENRLKKTAISTVAVFICLASSISPSLSLSPVLITAFTNILKVFERDYF